MADLAGQVDAVPLQGVHHLLDAIGFNDAQQRERIIAASLADYEDFLIWLRKISGTWPTSSASVRFRLAGSSSVLAVSRSSLE
jgi:hypothetical protein